MQTEITEKRPPRHTIKTDLIDRDYRYLKPLAAREGWTLNYLVRRIVNRWVTTHMAGQDIGVMPARLDLAEPEEPPEE